MTTEEKAREWDYLTRRLEIAGLRAIIDAWLHRPQPGQIVFPTPGDRSVQVLGQLLRRLEDAAAAREKST